MAEEISIFSFESFGIELKDSSINENEKVIFKKNSKLSIRKKGIYTLEGPNRSGKSVFIQMLMGALPDSIEIGKPVIKINGDRKEIKEIKDAYNLGIVTVFQNDSLIPTMNILEQYMLRHSPPPKVYNYLSNITYRILEKLKGIFTYKLFADNISEWLEKLLETNFFEKAFPEKLVKKEAESLFEMFELPKEFLRKYPHQLSGGTKARIKIINALLSKNIKILILDEALNAIAEEDCFDIIDNIKIWAKQNNATLLVVTHKKNEIFRWQPIGRFNIVDKKIIEHGLNEHDALDCGIHFPIEFITKFHSIEKAKAYIQKCDRPFTIFMDAAVEQLTPTKTLLEMLKKEGAINENTLVINEQSKSLEHFNQIIPNVIKKMPRADGTIIIIGGGVVLNFCAFIASTIYRGVIPHILVPTTLMAIADVAIGSKSSLNIEFINEDVTLKHILGTYTNPSCIIMDKEYVDSLNTLEIKIGLSECLKHGLLQDATLFQNSFALVMNSAPDTNKCFEIALRTQELKSNTLIKDPFEKDFGKILLYGHLHAHSIERFKDLSIPHGISVIWGIAIDLLLVDNEALYSQVLTIINRSELSNEFKKLKTAIVADTNLFKNLKKIYNSETKLQHYKSVDKYNIIKLTFLAEYAETDKLEFAKVNWNQVEIAIKKLLNDIQ
jgi:3-dehydroquinate synthetase/ABC-type dipeptide/oligopeptide/nickel transport system ATPase component